MYFWGLTMLTIVPRTAAIHYAQDPERHGIFGLPTTDEYERIWYFVPDGQWQSEWRPSDFRMLIAAQSARPYYYSMQPQVIEGVLFHRTVLFRRTGVYDTPESLSPTVKT